MVAGMSDYRHKRHNVSSLLYHIVCPAKYRRVIFDPEVDTILRDICLDIAQRYEIAFLEIGTDKDHVHFLVQSVPSYSPTKLVQIIKSLTARLSKSVYGVANFGPKVISSVPYVVTGMKQSFANMLDNRAVTKAIRNCIARTSSWGCSKVRGKSDTSYPSATPPNWRAIAVRKRGVDTSQLAAG